MPYVYYRLSTFGRRAFSVAGPTALTSNSFRQSLKTNLFRRCQHTQRCRDMLHDCAIDIDNHVDFDCGLHSIRITLFFHNCLVIKLSNQLPAIVPPFSGPTFSVFAFSTHDIWSCIFTRLFLDCFINCMVKTCLFTHFFSLLPCLRNDLRLLIGR